MSPRTISMFGHRQLRLLESSYTFSSSAMASSRALAAFFEHLGHVGLEVVLHQELVEGAERFLDGEGLREDVHAVVLVLDHLLDAPELAFEDARAVEGALLDVCDHGSRITLRSHIPLWGTCYRGGMDTIETTYPVSGMTCGHCAGAVTDELRAHRGRDPGIRRPRRGNRDDHQRRPRRRRPTCAPRSTRPGTCSVVPACFPCCDDRGGVGRSSPSTSRSTG